MQTVSQEGFQKVLMMKQELSDYYEKCNCVKSNPSFYGVLGLLYFVFPPLPTQIFICDSEENKSLSDICMNHGFPFQLILLLTPPNLKNFYSSCPLISSAFLSFNLNNPPPLPLVGTKELSRAIGLCNFVFPRNNKHCQLPRPALFVS